MNSTLVHELPVQQLVVAYVLIWSGIDSFGQCPTLTVL